MRKIIYVLALFLTSLSANAQTLSLSQLVGTTWLMETDFDEYTHATTRITFGRREYTYVCRWLFKKIRPTQKDEEKTDTLTFTYYLTDKTEKTFDATLVGKSQSGRHIVYQSPGAPSDQLQSWEITRLTSDSMTWTLRHRPNLGTAIGREGSPIVRHWRKVGGKKL